MTFMISILDKRQHPSTRVSFVFSWPHPLFSLGLACHIPGFDCPSLGQLSPVTLRSAVLTRDFFSPAAYFPSSLLSKVFPLSSDPLSLSSLYLIHASVFLSC